MMLKEIALQDLVGSIQLGKAKKTVVFNKHLVENPTPEVMSQAQVKLINKLIFDAIQEVQKQKSGRTSQEVYEYVKELDKELDIHVEMAFKIKDRDIKKSIM